jgi:hypothetical protein
MSRPTVAWYTIYLAATDEIVACGTAEDCVQALGLSSVPVFRSIVSHARHQPEQYPRYVILTEQIKRSELP